MSIALIDNWLSDELDSRKMSQLEDWLREDPRHLRRFYEAVQIQEELRLHYGGSRSAFVVGPKERRGFRLVAVVVAAAALIVASLVIVPQVSSPQPTADPLVWVYSGNPLVEVSRVDPGPNPILIPRDEWPVETLITVSDKSSVLRWGQDCVLDVGRDTSVALRSGPDDPTLQVSRFVRVSSGRVTVDLAASADAVAVLVGDFRILAVQQTTFTLEFSDAAAVLTVAEGDVELRFGSESTRVVSAGEHVRLP